MTGSNVAAIRDCSQWAQRWLTVDAFPIWLDRGTDWRCGGFFDSLSPSTLCNAADFKRLRVLARQIYVFSEATRMDVSGARDAVIHGLNFLFGPARLKSGGFARRFALDGTVLDDDLDLYDLAFVLFALAHAYDVLRAPHLQEEALSLLSLITTRMRHSAGGFLDGIPATLPRRQNPHMHLLEACLAWLQVAAVDEFASVADEIILLFGQRFFQQEKEFLLEYFDDNLLPSAALGFVVEPGHHFEWTWLLRQYSLLKGRPVVFDGLFRFAIEHGIDRRTGFLLGEVTPEGKPIASGCRLWPHTE